MNVKPVVVFALVSLVSVFSFADSYCLQDWNSDFTTPVKKCANFVDGNIICLRDNTGTKAPSSKPEQVSSYSSQGSRCIRLHPSTSTTSAASVDYLPFTTTNYADTSYDKVKSSVLKLTPIVNYAFDTTQVSTNAACNTDTYNKKDKSNNPVYPTGNGYCGKNGNSYGPAAEDCDSGKSGGNQYCDCGGNVVNRAVCVNKTSCQKNEDSIGTDGSDSLCQFLDPNINPTTGNANTACGTSNTDGSYNYCYQGSVEQSGLPGNSCTFASDGSGTCSDGSTCTAAGTCPKCATDADCKNIGTGICDVTSGTCTGCNSSANCTTNKPICSGATSTSNGVCVPCDNTNNTCQAGYRCSTQNGSCTALPSQGGSVCGLAHNGQYCRSNSDCCSNVCTSFACVGG